MLDRENIRPRTLLYGALAFLGLSAGCIVYGMREIPRDIEARAAARLAQGGLSPELVSLDGRIAILDGRVASFEERQEAEIGIAELRGVLRVDNRLRVVPAEPSPSDSPADDEPTPE